MDRIIRSLNAKEYTKEQADLDEGNEINVKPEQAKEEEEVQERLFFGAWRFSQKCSLCNGWMSKIISCGGFTEATTDTQYLQRTDRADSG